MNGYPVTAGGQEYENALGPALSSPPGRDHRSVPQLSFCPEPGAGSWVGEDRHNYRSAANTFSITMV